MRRFISACSTAVNPLTGRCQGGERLLLCRTLASVIFRHGLCRKPLIRSDWETHGVARAYLPTRRPAMRCTWANVTVVTGGPGSSVRRSCAA